MRTRTLVWVAAGLLVFFFVVGLANAEGSGTDTVAPDNDGDVEGTDDTGEAEVTKVSGIDPVKIVAAGIQHVEGWLPGSRSFRNNNPGNLRVTGATGETGTDASGMAIFDTYADGFDALLNDLQAKAERHPLFSILDVFKRYAPSQDGNNPNSYAAQIASDLSSALGKPVSVNDNWANLVNEYDGDGSDGDA